MLLGEQKHLKTLLNDRHCVPSLVACYLEACEVLCIVKSSLDEWTQVSDAMSLELWIGSKKTSMRIANRVVVFTAARNKIGFAMAAPCVADSASMARYKLGVHAITQ